MPDLIQVVVLSDAEREAVQAACTAAGAKAVGDEVSAALKNGDVELKTILRGPEVSQQELSTAKEWLSRRLDQLDQLPAGEAQSKHRQNVAEALHAIEEGLALY